MSTIGEIVVKGRWDGADLNRGLSEAAGRAEAFGARMSSIGKAMTVGITAPLVLLGKSVLDATADLDSLTRGLTAISGDAADTQRQLVRLADVAKLPGLGFREAIQGSIQLQAIGFSAGSAERYLKAFGNAIARTGGGAPQLALVNTQITQMASASKVLSADLRPIINTAPAVGKAIRDAFGTINSEAIQKMGIAPSVFLNRLVTELEKLPPTTGGVRNSIENLSDAWFRMRAAIGSSVIPVFAPLVSGLADIFSHVSRLDPAVLGLGVRLLAAAAIIGPLVFVAGQLVTAVTALAPAFAAVAAVMTGPFGIAAAAVIAAIIAIRTNFLGIGDAARAAWERVVEIMSVVLPATLPLVRMWINAQIGYFVGLARASAVVFEEIIAQHRRMIEATRPITSPVTSFLNRNVLQPSVQGTRDFFQSPFSKWRSTSPAPGIRDQFGLGEGQFSPAATAGTERQARNFGQRVADAFSSGFGRDFVGEGMGAMGDILARIRQALSARGAVDGGTPSFVDDLGSSAAEAGKRVRDLGNDVDELTRKLGEMIKARGPSVDLLNQTGLPFLANVPNPIRLDPGPLPVADKIALSGGEVAKDLSGLSSSIKEAIKKIREARSPLERVSDAGGSQFKSATDAVVNMAAQFTPAGLAAYALSSALESLRPFIDALLLPVKLFGEIIAISLVPILRLLFPVIKAVAIVLSYFQEGLDRVLGGILYAAGAFIKGLGKLINAIVPFGNPGNPLVKAGQAIQDTGKNFTEAAREIAKKRKELEALSFDDALKSTADAANKLTESMLNAVQGFKIARFRFDATEGRSVSASPAASSNFVGAVPSVVHNQNGPVSFIFTPAPDGSTSYYEDWKRGLQRDALRKPALRPFAAAFA